MDDYKKEPYWKLVEEFVEELKTATYWLKPDGKPLPEWKLFEAETLSKAREAAGNAARNAAGNAAWGAVVLDAAWDAATRGVALDAAWDAVREAAVISAAALDAALFARMLVCLDLPMKQKHLDHVNATMEVWRKGYCLLCDVDGALYVYAKKKIRTE